MSGVVPTSVYTDSGNTIRRCEHPGCKAFGHFGYGVKLTAGRPGRWYCRDHRPYCAQVLSRTPIREASSASGSANKNPENSAEGLSLDGGKRAGATKQGTLL